MTDSLFRPFETHLERESAREILKSTLIGAEDGELFLERCRSEVLSFDDGRLRTSSFAVPEGSIAAYSSQPPCPNAATNARQALSVSL